MAARFPMRPAAKFCLLLAVSALTAFSIRSLMAQDAESQVKREVERLQRSLKEKPITDPDFAPVNNMAADGLKSAAEALNKGQLYVSLERLNSASSLLQGARTGEEKADAVKSGLPAFETEWGKASLQLTSLDQNARQRDWSKSPLAIRALAEAAQGRSIPLLDGSRGFATSTKPKDGLFYMGQAQGEAEFAKFCASLQVPHKPASLTLRSFLPELQKLQEKTNAAFQPPKSIDQHSRFIALNSALKLAKELDSSKFYAGALYEYLEATRHYGMIEGAAVDPAKQATLKNAVNDAQKKLDTSPQDDSIAQLFIERANTYLTHPDGSAPTSDEWKAAQVILEQVLPAYTAAEKPAVPVQRASGKTVDITLVRWPYT